MGAARVVGCTWGLLCLLSGGMAEAGARGPVLVKAGQLRIVGAMQDLPTGRVSFLA